MYTVRVRDHVMIAHSFRGEVFGPAQKLHGATYVIDVEFRSPNLDENGIVIHLYFGDKLGVLADQMLGADIAGEPCHFGEKPLRP